MSSLPKALKLDTKGLARLLAKHGRGKDTMLAHITPREAKRLKEGGGSGTVNPKTGLLEFDDTNQSPYDLPAFGGTPNFDQGGGAAETTPSVTQAPDAGSGSPDTGPISVPQQSSQADSGTSTGGSDFLSGFFGGFGGSSPAPAAASGGYSPAASDASQLTGVSPQTNFAGADLGANAVSDVLGGGGGGPTTEQQGFGSKVLSSLTNPSNLGKILAGAGTAGVGLLMNRNAQKQGTAQANQISALGAPYNQLGGQQIQAASQGALTPMNAQAYQIAQAKSAQDAVNRGGVGAQQNIASLEDLRQRLLANQLDIGLKVQSVGDQYTMDGIKAQMASDQQVSASTANFYKTMFSVLGGLAPAGGARAAA